MTNTRVKSAIWILACCVALAGCGSSRPFAYVDGASLTCAMATDKGLKQLTWQPAIQALRYDGQALPILDERSRKRAVTIQTRLWGYDAQFTYSGETGQGTVSVQWPDGGVFLNGPCAMERR